MSHKMTVVFGEYDLNRLKESFEALGWLIKEDCMCRGVTGGRQALVAVNPSGSYDISIKVDAKGKISFQHEAYLTLNQTKLGSNLDLLKQEYQIQNAKTFAKARRGVVLKRTALQNNVELLELEITI